MIPEGDERKVFILKEEENFIQDDLLHYGYYRIFNNIAEKWKKQFKR